MLFRNYPHCNNSSPAAAIILPAFLHLAEQLYVSVNKVSTHRRNISSKLDIHSGAGLTIYAIINGLVDLPDSPNQ